MPSHPESHETWQERFRAVLEIVRRGFPQFVGFELLLKATAFVLFTPLTAWLTSFLINSSGQGAISNYEISSFFLSTRGFLYLALVASIGFTLLFLEFGGLTALGIALQRERTVRLPQLFRFLFASLPKLWRLSARQFLVYFAYALPALALTGGAFLFFLSDNDINYYLYAKPPAFWITAGIAALSALVFLYLATRRFIDWIHSVPLLLFAGLNPKEALQESVRLVRPHRLAVFYRLLRCLALFVLLSLVFILIIAAFKKLFFSLAGDRVGLVLGMTTLLAVLHFIGATTVGIISMSTLACSEARAFLRARPGVRLPASLSGKQHEILQAVVKILRASWVLLLLFGGLAVFTALKLIDTVTFDDRVSITAHRGSSITAPENTMAAIELAIDEGADFVEIDVQETRDGVVVLVHDKDLNRVFGINKGIWEVDFADLKDLDSGGWFSPKFSDQRLATLDQVIKAVKGRTKLNIELKFNGHHEDLARRVVRIVRDNGFSEDCILTSLDYRGLRRAAEAGPEIKTGIIVTSALGDITKLDTDLLSVSAGAVNRSLIESANRNGLAVHVWTINDISTMNSMIGMGVDSIITDDPALLGKVIAEHAQLSNTEKVLLQLADITIKRF